ncbi:hypothetical protein [Chamaesiphon polymorphus]|uniref:hypothetical protein n=1 Tax=Chamaesiphon polymorphus TaxID=2107691 RepID=UPI0015E63286|nr:hypothetical protein [Chamaesiphon polymorphus]
MGRSRASFGHYEPLATTTIDRHQLWLTFRLQLFTGNFLPLAVRVTFEGVG